MVEPSGGSKIPEMGGTNLLFSQIFVKNCMKMKVIGLRGGAYPPAPSPPDLPMGVVFQDMEETTFCDEQLQFSLLLVNDKHRTTEQYSASF